MSPASCKSRPSGDFPCDVQTLHVVTSLVRDLPPANNTPTLVGIPKNHLARLEQALRAAKLKPFSFSLGITALQPPGVEASNGVMALAIGESHVGLQVTAGGGVAALRALEGALEAEGSQRVLHATSSRAKPASRWATAGGTAGDGAADSGFRPA